MRFTLVGLLLSGCGSMSTWNPGIEAFRQPAMEEAFPGRSADWTGEAEVVFPDGHTYLVPFAAMDGLAVAGGDIVLGPAADYAPLRAVAATPEFRRWPSCTVPFSIDPSLDSESERDFRLAVSRWGDATDLTFVEAPGAASRIVVRGGQGCWSHVGRTGGAQTLTLSPICGLGAALHEVGHAIGLNHEHSRTDSEAYVEKHWDRMIEDRQVFFRTVEERGLESADVGEYDLTSIMHYASWAFAETPGCSPEDTSACTLTHLDGSYLSEVQRARLSDGDLAAIATLYDCEGVPPMTFPPPEEPDDHADDFDRATGIQVAGEQSSLGELTAGDVDMFRLYVEVDGPFSVFTSGETDTFGTLYDLAGNEITSDDDSGEAFNFRLDHTASAGEQLFVAVRGYSESTEGPFTIHTQAAELPPPVVDPIVEIEGAIPVTLLAFFGDGDATETGVLGAGETVTYRVSVESGGPVTLTAFTTGPTDVSGTLLSGAGDLLQSDETEGNFALSATVTPGVYFVQVHGASQDVEGSFGIGFTAEL